MIHFTGIAGITILTTVGDTDGDIQAGHSQWVGDGVILTMVMATRITVGDTHPMVGDTRTMVGAIIHPTGEEVITRLIIRVIHRIQFTQEMEIMNTVKEDLPEQLLPVMMSEVLQE